ncbi:MAG: YhcH/YjgK/YiaL family protein [Rouxiella aceris]|uniref:YhcH/YjgK/YiaL family protein n=1 Tax=Rouxiella aceris TaxID=2703884 RepID=UPI00283EDEFB|nr:YhcH/YjgK/YiaL family protein [Rouxiella aceris]MDR3430532.1 YhcH/YjgK/YiaL family protein [Rouxiella aceris]
MIVCCLRDWESEKNAFHPIINKGIEFITQTDFSTLSPGKYDIIPEKMFCLYQEMTTLPAEEMRAESHFKFIDIQFLLQGEETIGVARGAADHQVVEDRAEKHDIVFYQQTQNESLIHLVPGMFAVFFPQDLHRPCCHTHGESFIRKAVIKIHLSLFDHGLIMNNQ